MKYLSGLLLVLFFQTGRAQTIEQVDSVCGVLCEFLNQLDVKGDSAIALTLNREGIQPYLRTVSDSKKQQVAQQLYYRMQRGCPEFLELLNRINPPKSDFERLKEKPQSIASEDDLKDFKSRKEFYYFEFNRDTTVVQMKKGKWTDVFADGTKSHLTYKWLSDNEFELVFKKSNNETRKNFSVKGDKYVYQILSQKNNYFELSVNIPGQKTYDKFKMYFKE